MKIKYDDSDSHNDPNISKDDYSHDNIDKEKRIKTKFQNGINSGFSLLGFELDFHARIVGSVHIKSLLFKYKFIVLLCEC